MDNHFNIIPLHRVAAVTPSAAPAASARADDGEHDHPTARLLVALIGFGLLVVGIAAVFA